MFEVATVIKNPSEDFKGIAGIELLLLNSTKQYPESRNERLVINPMTKEGFETFYRDSFESMGKEMISDDWKYFLKYMLDGNCEFTCHIEVSDIENIREVTEEDVATFNKAFKEFIEGNGLKLGEEGEVSI